jgi:hypothetical protein
MKSRRKIYNLLFEQEEAQDVDVPEKNVSASKDSFARKSADSLDDQLDSLILMYEKDAIKKDDIAESLRYLSLGALLKEQEDEPAEEGGDDTAEAPAEEPSEPSGSESMDPEVKPATSQKVPNLDIDEFAINIARMIMNYESLLDVKKVIINRAKNHLDKNYGDAYVKRFLETLEEQFGITSEEFDIDYNTDVPFAIGANPAGAGSVGG